MRYKTSTKMRNPNANMAEKFYRVKKDTFMWKAGCILICKSGDYHPIVDIWDQVELKDEYIREHIIEHPDNADWFERVYPDTIKGMLYRTKDQMVTMYQEAFK
jgi:hypothetical protein